MQIIELKNIQKSYNNRVVLNNVSLNVFTGEMVGIMGRSGSGKTTLLNILGLLDKPDSGSYFYKGRDISTLNDIKSTEIRRDNIGFVIQNYALINHNNVFFNIALPLLCKKHKKKDVQVRVEKIADKVGISNLLGKHPHELSGGECQRVAIARALIRNPDIILADEPTGALDIETEHEILSIFRELNNEGVTILLVTHDESVANQCHKIYDLNAIGLQMVKNISEPKINYKKKDSSIET